MEDFLVAGLFAPFKRGKAVPSGGKPGGMPLFRVCLLTAVLALGGVSCGPDPESAGRPDSREVEITRVVDGDTVEISPTIEGIEDVRLIRMDTPEVSGECGAEPLAREAEDYTMRHAGVRVSLDLGEERTDRYGRLLAYVRLPDGDMLNERLVRRGLAQVATFPPNVRYEEDFREAQRLAREESIGIWGLSSERRSMLADRGNGIGGDGC
ncbi:thermonuclease family protein [Rubrobacter aplysinae]|uniref:thermonuclease family protein n=1 Tax=Rubrobacter aplysinae TaxID=909625 RepID=UPI00069D7DDA|nr:thermonuclease family protein [Rubrobacter aplysinae]